MDKYPIAAANGLKLALEDVEAGWLLAGKAGDKVRAQLAQIPVSAGDRTGWVVPVVDGPIVIPNGASGTVKVNPFTAYRGPNGSETTQDLLTAFYAGSNETVPTPLPTAGNHRWDLLYAIISETDSDSESRLVEDPVTGDLGTATLNTRHKSVVTLAWVQGTVSPTATDPYPAANWPAVPTPAAGEAIVPLAYVHVHYSATPATVTYDVNRVFNAPRHAKINPQTGAESIGVAGLSRLTGGSTFGAATDTKTIFTTTTGLTLTTSKRPPHIFEPAAGGHRLWLPLTFAGSTAVGAGWAIIGGPGGALITPDSSKAIQPHNPLDLLNRWYSGRLQMSHNGGASVAWAHDQDSAAADCVFPTSMPSGVNNVPPVSNGWGNTIRGNGDLDTELVAAGAAAAGDWYAACVWRDVLGTGAATDMALLVRRVTSGGYTKGAMHLAAREAVASSIDGRYGVIILDVSPQFFPFGF